MKKITIILCGILMGIVLQSFGQTTVSAPGCVIVFGTNANDVKIYRQSLGTFSTCNGQTVEEFSNTGSTTTLPAGCWYNPNPSPAPGTFRNCIIKATGSCGVKVNGYQCPIDDEVWILMGGTVLTTLFFFRRRLI